MRYASSASISSIAFRLAGLIMLIGTAGCSSDAQRIEMPWSVPVASNSSSSNPQSEYTGSIGKPSSPSSFSSQSLPPVASALMQPVSAPPAAKSYYQAEPQQSASSSSVVIGKGDTLYSISRQHGVPVSKLISANGLANANDIKIGQRLSLQGGSVAKRSEPASRSFAASALVESGVHTVNDGETLSSISSRYKVAPGEVARANAFSSDHSLAPGQKLVIPGKHAPQSASGGPVTKPAASISLTEKQEPKQTAVLNEMPAQPVPGVAQESVKSEAKPEVTASLPNPEPMNSTEFRWPVRGRVVQNFGPQQGGGKNDGINIAVPDGTPVKAAENGVVAYAGSELKGYGNLVLIRHDNDYVTAYAHNKDISVKRGDKVTRGQVIGKAGQSGNVAQPQLHFEIRKGSNPVDPLRHLVGG